MVEDEVEKTARPRRGRPRKWTSEAARREHEAAKRRLRNKTTMTPDEFDDIVRLTALADDLQRQLAAAATTEIEQLRQRNRELERRLTETSRRLRANPEPPRSAPTASSPPVMNRQRRREAERAQRRTSGQPERSPPPI